VLDGGLSDRGGYLLHVGGGFGRAWGARPRAGCAVHTRHHNAAVAARTPIPHGAVAAAAAAATAAAAAAVAAGGRPRGLGVLHIGECRADVGQGRPPEGGGGGARRRAGGHVEHLPRGRHIGAVGQKRVGGARHRHGPEDGRGGGRRHVGHGGERRADERGEAHPNLDRRRCHRNVLPSPLRRAERRPQVPHIVQQPLGGTKERVLVRLDAAEAACERRQVRLHRHVVAEEGEQAHGVGRVEEARGACVAHDRCSDGYIGTVEAPHDRKVDGQVQTLV